MNDNDTAGSKEGSDALPDRWYLCPTCRAVGAGEEDTAILKGECDRCGAWAYVRAVDRGPGDRPVLSQ